MSSGQGLTRDTLEEVTEAEDLWLQSLERKNPDKKPRTADARPVSRAMVTAWNRTDQCDCVTESLLVRIFFLTIVSGRVWSSESDLLDLTEMRENFNISTSLCGSCSISPSYIPCTELHRTQVK